MAKFFPALDDQTCAFIARQNMFFVASAPREGRVNVSPKGMDSLRVLDNHRIAYLDLTGSGNETAAHILDNGRVTLMFCAFEGAPLILRAYGRGDIVLPYDTRWHELLPLFPALPGARQIIVMHIESVQTSCGFAVPLYDFEGHRETLTDWVIKKGADALVDYRAEKNSRSIDGLPSSFSAN